MNMLRFLRCIPLAALALLAACNSGEDFSEGTTVGGGLISLAPADPLDPLQDAVEVELVAAVQTPSGMRSAVVTNLGYTCGSVDFYMPAVAPGEPGNTRNLPQHIARCPLDAKEVRFFIGRRASDFGKRFYIGTARIPRCSSRDTADCGKAAGFYQFAVADLVNTPERIDSDTLPASARLALLAVLDSKNSTDSGDATDDLLIEIPNEAHDVTSEQFDSLVPLASTGSQLDVANDYASYAAFTDTSANNGWDTWRSTIQTAVQDAIDNDGADYSPLPDWPSEADSQDGARFAGQRVRAGLFQFSHNSNIQAPEYALSFPDQTRYQRLFMGLLALVFPDGTLIGMGPLTAIPVTDDGDDANTQPDLVPTDVSSDLGIISGGATVDNDLYLDGPGSTVSLRTFFEYDTRPTDLDLSGRFIGNIIYDALAVEQGDGSADRADFTEDYPIADGDTIYDIREPANENDRGRVSGVLLGDNTYTFDHPDGIGFRAAKTATVAGSLDADVAPNLPPFYRLTFWKACISDSAQSPPYETTACSNVPLKEVGDDGSNANYPEFLAEGDDYPDGYPVTQEQRREFVSGDNGEVNLQILSDGTLVTDRDQDCSAVDENTLIDGVDGDGQIQEYKVGFITRTLEDDETGNLSANIVVYLVGDADLADSSTAGYMPQFGTLVQGRMNLGTAAVKNELAPLYRLSDPNYNAEIRAAWTDLFQSNVLAEDNFDPDATFDDQDFLLKREFEALGSGAAQGQAQYPNGAGSCQLTDPNP